MSRYDEVRRQLQAEPKKWLVTGCAGFIGSNLVEYLLKLDQTVAGVDNFSTGKLRNLDEVRTLVTADQWARFTFTEGDVRNLETCKTLCRGVDYVLHEAALGSVPRSLEDPINSNDNNFNGTLNILVAVRDEEVKRMVYAASSSTFCDHPGFPKVEDVIVKPLSH